MDPQRYLRCLGQPALFASNGEVVRFRTKKHLALLVYLAVENRSHRRDRLAELLWPKVSATEARHSLATALSVLRPRLGLDGLEASRDHARLTPGRVLLDLERLQSGDVLGSEVSEPLQVAAFLDGFDIVDSAEFTLWKDQQQARLLPIIKDALLVLIDRCRRIGDTRQIEQLADRMLALDDLSEEAIRAKIEARAFAGDRLTALEIFEIWKKKLAEELHAAPSDLVEGMAVRLRRRGWERTTLAHIPNVPTDQWRGRPFIGRAAEYRALYEQWEAAKKGAPGHALIVGDSGVGKTTLVQRLTTAAGLEGAAISRVQSYDVEREIPYSTLNGLVLGLLDRPGVSATPPDALAELSRTVPEVRQRFPNIPAPMESEGETARIRITEAFLQMLLAIADEHPVVLVLDDLHLADDVSLAVLHLIMRRAGGRPIMVVLIARSGELVHSSQAVRMHEGAASLSIREIELSPLTCDESRDMLHSLIEPGECQPSLVEERALLRAAAGYPMVLELLVQDWRVRREHPLALGIDAMTSGLEGEGSAHLAYRHILYQITKSLDSTTQNVLNLAAILGPRLNDLGMYALVDLSAGQTMTALAELVSRRVLRDGAQGLEFVNELVRTAAYIAVPSSLRRVLHSNIADRFLVEYNTSNDELDLEIAWHCVRAGRNEEATKYLLSGARVSIRKGAVHSAERALSSALPHLRGTEHTAATLLLAEVMQEQGRWLDSETLLKSVDQCGSDTQIILSLKAEYWAFSPSSEKICANIHVLRKIVDASADIRARIKAVSAMAQFISSLRDVDLARCLLRSIDSIPTTDLSLDDLATFAASKARLLYDALERGPCLTELMNLAAKLRNTGHINSTVASLHTGLGALACCQGRYLQAKQEFLIAYDIDARLGNDTARGCRAAQVALACFRLGEYRDSVEWSRLTIGALDRPVSWYFECQAANYIGCSQAILGETEKALQTIRDFEAAISASLAAWVKQAWLLAKADILMLSGMRADAIAVGREAIGGRYPHLWSHFFAGQFARWLALTSIDETSRRVAGERVASMLKKLDSFDAIDQIEIMYAHDILARDFLGTEEYSGIIQTRLEEFPAAVTQQLAMLCALSPEFLPQSASL